MAGVSKARRVDWTLATLDETRLQGYVPGTNACVRLDARTESLASASRSD